MLSKTSQLKIIKVIMFITVVSVAACIFSLYFYFNVFYSALSGLSASSSPEEYAYRLAFVISGVILLVLPLLLITGFTLTRNIITNLNNDIKIGTFQKIILATMIMLDIFVMYYIVDFMYYAIA